MIIAKSQVSVVIPIYRINLKESEHKSLYQCLDLLGHYHVSFIHAESFNFHLFCEVNKVNKTHYNITNVVFPDFYFDGIAGYNSLLLNNKFYQTFSKFQYILIYQLDAWVFKDELSFWLSQNYDYIGAPWIGNKHPSIIQNKVGNGGFSLRKVNSFLKILNSPRFNYSPVLNFSKLRKSYLDFYGETNQTLSTLKHLKVLFKSLVRASGYNNTLNYFRYQGINEDVLWGVYVPSIFPDFRIPSIDVAIKFSIESNPEYFMSLISPILPFGCHAWERWGKDFWQPYIISSLLKD